MTSDPEQLLQSIAEFIASCRAPAVLEEGDEVIPLLAGSYQLEVRNARLWVEVSSGNRLLCRRITSVRDGRPGILDCAFQRFGGQEGKLTFLDLQRPQTAHRQRVGARHSFAGQFRRMLSRQLPQWHIAALSSSMDLRRSFSPVFPRARLEKGSEVLAAIACPAPQHEAHFLSFALLWFHHVRSSLQPGRRVSLCLFLPDAAGCLTAHRLRWLEGNLLGTRIYRFNEHGSAGEVDLQDLGNLETRVGSHSTSAGLSEESTTLLHRLSAVPHVSLVPKLNGAISIRFQGTEFAHIEHGRLTLGLQERREIPSSRGEEVMEFACQLLELSGTRSAAPVASPERWLEGAVRNNIQVIHPDLLPEPVHGQVLTFAGEDRDAVDLLAASPNGRLTVLELKASEDLHLPLQALDYWIRIREHSGRGELSHLFPALHLSRQSPRLTLLAPAVSFHSSNAAVLRYFSPEVEVERVGVNIDWQTRLKVVMRLSDADVPLSHRRSSGIAKPSTHP